MAEVKHHADVIGPFNRNNAQELTIIMSLNTLLLSHHILPERNHHHLLFHKWRNIFPLELASSDTLRCLQQLKITCYLVNVRYITKYGKNCD